jgi:hypothetical protein
MAEPTPQDYDGIASDFAAGFLESIDTPSLKVLIRSHLQVLSSGQVKKYKGLDSNFKTVLIRYLALRMMVVVGEQFPTNFKGEIDKVK